MERQDQRPKYEKIGKDDEIVPKKYKNLNTTFMTKFNKGKDIVQDNSNLKYNQISVIEKYGLFYFYNESGIYFIDNSKLRILKVEENKDISYSDLFFLKCDNIFSVFQLEVKEQEKLYLIICTKNPYENSFLIYICIDTLIEAINNQENIYDINIIKKIEEKLEAKEYFTREINELEKNIELNEEGIYEEQPLIKKLSPEEKLKKLMEEKNKKLEERNEIFEKAYKNPEKYEYDKITYLDENFEEIIILDYENYIVRYNNGDIIFYKNYERTRIIEKKALKINYNKETNIFLILNKEAIIIFKEKDNFTTLQEKKKILLKNILSTSINDEKIIHIENIYNFIILYSIENKEEPEKDDQLYFLQMNSNMDDIIKIYLEKQHFYPDEYGLEGIAYESHLKRSVFTVYDKDINVYFVINKHMDLLDKYYGFKKINGNIYDLISFELNDDQKLNSRIPGLDKFQNNEEIEKIETNPFIGISIIKFKFDSYNDDYEMLNGEEFISPYLMFILGYNGGFKVCYIINEVQKKDEEIEYQLKEQTDFFKMTNNISNKCLGIKINDEIIEMEKEKFLYDSKKKESFREMLNIKKLNLRNIFLHGLDSQIKDNLKKIKKSAYSDKIKIELYKLGEISKNKIFEEMQKSIQDLIKNAEELFKQEEENQRFIKKNKEITEKNKNLEINIKNQIKQLEDDKNKFKELFLNINSPINLILTHQKIKNFFGEKEVNFMINFFNKIKNNINLFQNHSNLIERINEINSDLITNIENCKKNYISKKDYDCLKKRKDFQDVKKNIQNNIFIMYMKSLYTYFWELYQFKEKEMTDELNNLNELKRKYYSQKNFKLNYENEEEKKENNIINNNKRKKFVLKPEEDIDEGNNSDNYIHINNINNISNVSNSFQNQEEQRLVLANDNNIINNNYNNKDILIEREKEAIVNKLFNTNLVKEKNFIERNKLSEILSNFEGRVTLYDESTEDDNCINAEELFSEFLIDEEEEKKAKALKEKKQKENDKKINYIEKSLIENKKERDKIEEELKKIEDQKKAEIIEKDKQIQQLKNIMEELNKKFQENTKEREKEKKLYKEEMEKKSNEGQKKITEEKIKKDEIIKKYEKEIQEMKNKLSQEEQKRKEIEEKNRKLEQEMNNNSANRINNQNTVINDNSTDTQNQNIFIRNKSSTNVEQKKDNEEDKSKNVFQDLNFKPEESINNIELFTSNKNENNNKKEENINNELKGIFKTENNFKSNINNIFSGSNANNQKNIFDFANNNSNNQNQNQSQNNPQNNNNPTNNLFGLFNNSIKNDNNKNNLPQNISQNPPNNISGSLFGQNISFGNNLGNQGQSGNLIGQSQIFGQHLGIGQTSERKKNESSNSITYSFKMSQNNNQNNNSTSPFAGAMGGGLFGNNNRNNQNGNQNQDNFF